MDERQAAAIFSMESTSDEGLIIHHFVEQVVDIQNQFLNTLPDAAAALLASAVGVAANGDDRTNQAVPIHHATARDILRVNRQRLQTCIAEFQQQSYAFGAGRSLSFDLHALEQQLLLDCAAGCQRLQIIAPAAYEFRFLGELNRSAAIAELRAHLPAQSTLPFEQRKLVEESLGRLQEMEMTRLSHCLDNGLSFLRRLNNIQDSSLRRFFVECLQMQERTVPAVLLDDHIGLRLKHLLDFDSLVQDALAGDLADKLNQSCRVNLETGAEQQLRGFAMQVRNRVADEQVIAFMRELRLLLFRILGDGSGQDLGINSALVDWLQADLEDRFRWIAEFPREIRVANALHAYKVLSTCWRADAQ